MTTAMLLTTPNHKMGHDFMNSFTPSRMDDSLLQKMIFSTPNKFTVSTPITPSSTSQSSAVSKYVNLGTIGEGSYGLVLKCKDRQNGRVVAIKKFIESEEDKSVRKIAMREIHLLKQLRHENLVNLLEVFRRKRRLYLVFEFVEKSLLDHLDTSPSGLERGQCRRILYQVIRALEFCHIHNIIHRDVKPENVLISKHGVVKLCDFGFARTLAKPGEIYTEYVSTRWYRAPELLVGDIRYGRAVDIWALGCLSAEMMTGQPLFPGDSDIDQLFSIVKCFGCLCRRHEERLYSSPMFRFEISQIEVTEPLKCRLRGCTSREFQFVASCLELDPQDRPTCSSLMRHPLFTCDGFNSWFPEELQQMLRKDADEHKLQPERPKPRRQLPDLNKCLQLSSTPIKGYGQVTPLGHHPHHTPDPGRHHDHKHPAKDLPGKTHRNLEEAFGSCTVAAADEGLHGTGRDDISAPQDESVNSSLNFDLQPLDLSSSFNNNNNISSTTCLDLDLSFSHLSIVEGIEVEGEELPHKSMNIDEEDDYASEANEGDYASEDDDYAENSVRVVRGKSPRSNEGLNYEGGDGTNGRQHPVSLLSCDSQKKLDNVNNNTAINNNNNKNNQSKKKKQNNKVHQSLPMSSSSSSSASSSSAMTSLPSPSSSATTSGVSSPTSSSSSSSSSGSMRKFSKNSTNSINHFNNNSIKNNRNNNINHRNNNINNRNNNINNRNNNINNRNNNFINNSSSSLDQSPRGSHPDVTSKSQNQKFLYQSSTTNTKSDKQHTNSYKPDSIHHHYQHHHQQQQNQQHQQQGRAPCKPLQQKNIIHPFHQQSRQQQLSQQQQQQKSHCKQVENESPKFGQKFFQQPKHQNSHQKHQQQQRQQNVQPKPTKKKDFGRQNPSTSKHVAKQPFVPIGANDGQSKTAYRNS